MVKLVLFLVIYRELARNHLKEMYYFLIPIKISKFICVRRLGKVIELTDFLSLSLNSELIFLK